MWRYPSTRVHIQPKTRLFQSFWAYQNRPPAARQIQRAVLIADSSCINQLATSDIRPEYILYLQEPVRLYACLDKEIAPDAVATEQRQAKEDLCVPRIRS